MAFLLVAAVPAMDLQAGRAGKPFGYGATLGAAVLLNTAALPLTCRQDIFMPAG